MEVEGIKAAIGEGFCKEDEELVGMGRWKEAFRAAISALVSSKVRVEFVLFGSEGGGGGCTCGSVSGC